MAKAFGASVLIALVIAASCATLAASEPGKLAAEQAQSGLPGPGALFITVLA